MRRTLRLNFRIELPGTETHIGTPVLYPNWQVLVVQLAGQVARYKQCGPDHSIHMNTASET